MVSNRQRGRQFELRCKRKLESKGWLIHLTDMPQRFKKQQDFFSILDVFGGFDLIGVRSLHKDKNEKIYVQVKYNYSGKKKIVNELKWFKDTYLNPDDIVQFWNYRKKSKRIEAGWVIHDV